MSRKVFFFFDLYNYSFWSVLIGFLFISFSIPKLVASDGELKKPVLHVEMDFFLTETPGLKRIRAFDVDDEGSLCLLDHELNRVYLFDRSGKKICEIAGKSATEPFSRASGVAFGRKGEIGVSDYGACAVLYFSKEGDYLRQTVREDLCLYSLMILGNGNIAAKAAPLDGGPFRTEAKLMSSDLDPISTKGSVLSPQQGDTIDPFWISMIWKKGANGFLYYSHPREYEIEIFNADGQKVGEIIKKSPLVKITEAEKKEASKKPVPPGYRFQFSEYRSAFQGFSIDEKGRVYVQTWERAAEPKGAYLFDVFDEKGEPIGRFPLDVIPSAWKDGKLYVIGTTMTGEQKVTRYSVEWEDGQPISP